jgi:hypothetical protein
LGSIFWAGGFCSKTASCRHRLLITGMEMLAAAAYCSSSPWQSGELVRSGSFNALPWPGLSAVVARRLCRLRVAVAQRANQWRPLVRQSLVAYNSYFLGKEFLALRVLAAAGLIIGSVVLVSVRKTR